MIRLGLPVGLENYHDKLITVTNTGKNDAYVRVYVAVPAALEAKTAEAGDFTDKAFSMSTTTKILLGTQSIESAL